MIFSMFASPLIRSLPILSVAAAALVLASCGGNESGSGDVGNRSATYIRGVEVCVSGDLEALGLNLEFEGNENSSGPGPFRAGFPVCGNRFGQLKVEIYNDDAEPVWIDFFENAPVGEPLSRPYCHLTPEGAPSRATPAGGNFWSEGDALSYACGPYRITTIRGSDNYDYKYFEVDIRAG